MQIRQAQIQDAPAVILLAQALWPHHTAHELREELLPLLGRKDAAFFLAYHDESPIGYAQCQLRRDYVEGCSSSPVGYLEGIYVAAAFRRRDVARALLARCEEWARECGCAEFASDCELGNRDSLAFHMKAGFTEAGRIICFCKTL